MYTLKKIITRHGLTVTIGTWSEKFGNLWSGKCIKNTVKVINYKWLLFQGNNFFWICSNYSLVESFPQSPAHNSDDQIRLEATSTLISKYHTLTGTWTTTKGFLPGKDHISAKKVSCMLYNIHKYRSYKSIRKNEGNLMLNHATYAFWILLESSEKEKKKTNPC